MVSGHTGMRCGSAAKGTVSMTISVLLYCSHSIVGPTRVASAFTTYRPFAAQRLILDSSHRLVHRDFRTAVQGSFDDDAGSDKEDTILLALTSTERWIEETLSGMGGGDAYTRKKISYECETGTAIAGIMCGIFRRLREIREMGEEHGRSMELLDSEDKQSTLRLTSVLVMPSSKELRDEYSLFDGMVECINKARRDARDYSIDADSTEGSGGTVSATKKGDKWITAVNLSHMHPKFGEDDSSDANEDDSEELKAYKEQRKRARQSPYPTVVFEVKSSPSQPMEKPLGGLKPPPSADPEKNPSVSSEDVKRIEAMFGKPADEGVGEADAKDDDDAAATAVDLFAKSVFSPIGHAQNWVVENDPHFLAEKSSFVVSDRRQVDGIYEFVLSLISSSLSAGESRSFSAIEEKRDYIILHNFCTKSATSVEKFQIQLCNMIKLIPGLRDVLSVSNFHPEQLDKDLRCPAPILVLQWGSSNEDLSEEEGAFE